MTAIRRRVFWLRQLQAGSAEVVDQLAVRRGEQIASSYKQSFQRTLKTMVILIDEYKWMSLCVCGLNQLIRTRPIEDGGKEECFYNNLAIQDKTDLSARMTRLSKLRGTGGLQDGGLVCGDKEERKGKEMKRAWKKGLPRVLYDLLLSQITRSKTGIRSDVEMLFARIAHRKETIFFETIQESRLKTIHKSYTFADVLL
ncbi:hypothetical protein CAPTEDRAFT_190390 [Capitella teleta]|uniref:Uncharacterized protein n=1 Tax=Capitella teleta TaxID=283909 RepID=R7U8X5_CAPTE|nr:hypothetical protein CAPTEDRAFT_190390 [Capitella teleta]|eukprot:ELU02581.1 hypothetical protein CAPTEDRAFT_190390 [Capitella teleta]